MCLGHKAFGLPQTVADPAVVGLGLHVPGFVVVPVLDEVIAQADDVGQLLFCGAHRLNGGVQPGVGGFQLLDVLLGLKALVSAVFADGGQHLAGDPALESLCLGHLAGQNQAVQAGLVNKGWVLIATDGVLHKFVEQYKADQKEQAKESRFNKRLAIGSIIVAVISAIFGGASLIVAVIALRG